MTKTCTICGTVNASSTVYCDGCGVELASSLPAAAAAEQPVHTNPVPETPISETLEPVSVSPTAPISETEPVPVEAQQTALPSPVPFSPALVSLDVGAPALTPAYLSVKKHGALTGDRLPLLGERLVMGRFDASSGPVDLDVTGLPGAEHISRRHAELAFEQGRWVVRDLGSTNGVYVKRSGEASFSPRIQDPTPLNHGDELAVGNLMLLFQEG